MLLQFNSSVLTITCMTFDVVRICLLQDKKTRCLSVIFMQTSLAIKRSKVLHDLLKNVIYNKRKYT